MKNFIKKHWPLLLSIAYLIWPIDILPDFLLPIGALDDTGLLILAVIREIIVYVNANKSKPSASQPRKVIEGEVIRKK